MSNQFPAYEIALAASKAERMKLAQQLKQTAVVVFLLTLLIAGYVALPDDTVPRTIETCLNGYRQYAEYYVSHLRVVFLLALCSTWIWMYRTNIIACKLREVHKSHPEWPTQESNRWLKRMYWSFSAAIVAALVLVDLAEIVNVFVTSSQAWYDGLIAFLATSFSALSMLLTGDFEPIKDNQRTPSSCGQTPPPEAYVLPTTADGATQFKVVRPIDSGNAYEQGYLFGRYNPTQEFPAYLGTGLSAYAFEQVKRGFMDGQAARSALINQGHPV